MEFLTSHPFLYFLEGVGDVSPQNIQCKRECKFARRLNSLAPLPPLSKNLAMDSMNLGRFPPSQMLRNYPQNTTILRTGQNSWEYATGKWGWGPPLTFIFFSVSLKFVLLYWYQPKNWECWRFFAIKLIIFSFCDNKPCIRLNILNKFLNSSTLRYTGPTG